MKIEPQKGQFGNVAMAFQECAKKFPEHVALKADGGLGSQYSYHQVADLVLRLAGSFLDSRFTDVDRIGILSENRPEWVIAYLGIITAGKIVVPIDANLKPQEIRYIIKDSGIKILFISGKYEKSMPDGFEDLTVFSFENKSDISWQTLLKGHPIDRCISGNPLAALIYTSGTTGKPKVVMITHNNLLSNVEGVEDALHFDEHDVFLSLLPLHHTYEATCGFITPIISGATIVYARSLKSKEILEDIAYNKVGILCGVPLLFEKMNHAILRGVQQATLIKRIFFHILYWLSSFGWMLGYKWGRLLLASIRQKAGLSTIRMFVSGGAPLPSSTARFFNYLGIDFLQGYGLTECSPVISTNRPDNIKFGSVGPPLNNIEVRIHEPDSNGIGEIAVRGNAVTPGYLDNQTATDEVIRDGWLFTGDMGYLKGGHLWITGRRKNVIVTAAGKNIYPEELEEKLGESRFILETVVFGRRKESKQGEEVSALIVPDIEQFKVEFGMLSDNPDPDKIKEVIAGIVEDVNGRIAEYKRISSFDVQLQELEKTSTKKVKRFMYNQGDVQ